MMDDAPVGGGDVGTLKAGNKYGEIVVCDPKNQDFIHNKQNTNQPLARNIAELIARQRDLGTKEFFYCVSSKEYVDTIKNLILYNAKSPLDQFEIRNLISLDVPILGYLRIFVTNIAFYLVTATVIAFTFNLLATNKEKIVANY